MTWFRPLARLRALTLVGPLLLLSESALAAGTTIRGVVLGGAQAPLVGVRVTADEVGISRDTDSKGQFSLTVPPEVANKGLVRLAFSLRDHQTQNEEVKLPLLKRLEVILTPLYARTFQPTIPPGLASRLRIYRKGEISRVHAFLGSPEKKLLSVEGMAGVGSLDMVLVALQDAPKAVRRPILWWDCEETDSLTMLAEEWARAFRDPNLGNLAQRHEKVREPRDRRELDRETLAQLLNRFEKTSYTIVLNRFDRWLAASAEVEERSLAEFLERMVAHPQVGQLILLTEEKPALPRNLNPAWNDVLVVRGFSAEHSLDYLREYLGTNANPELLRQAAMRLDGYPVALQMLGGSLADLEPSLRDSRLRQFLQVGESAFSGASLGPLFASAHARLTTQEIQVLDLLTAVRQPLTSEEIQQIGIGREELLTPERVQRAIRRLARERYWLESVQRSPEGEESYRLAEVTRLFLEERLEDKRAWKAELHRRAFAWYQKRFPVAKLDPMVLPLLEDAAGYNELVYQAFSLAEVTLAEERRSAILIGGQVISANWNGHILRDAKRLLLSQWLRALRLLEGQANRSSEEHRLYANTLMSLGDLYVRTYRPSDAEKRYEEALPLYRAIEDRLGEANTLKSLGDLYVYTDRLSDAEKRYEGALSLYRAIGDRLGEANTLMSLGDLYVRTNRLSDAEQRYEEALPLYHAIENRSGEANTLKSLGNLYVRTDRLSDAEKRYEKAMSLYRAIESRSGEANTLKSLGDLYVRKYRLADAKKWYEEALPLYRVIEDRLGEANTLKSLGDLYVRKDRLLDAEKRYEEVLPLYRAIEERLGEANTLRSLGDLYSRTDRLSDAEQRYEEALPLYRAIEDRLGEANTLRSLGDLYGNMNRLSDAEKRFEEALPLYRRIEARLGEASTLMSLGYLYVHTDRLSDAEKRYEEALSLYRAIEARLGEANTLILLGDLYVRTARLLDAEALYEEALPMYRAIENRLGEASTLLGIGTLRLAQEQIVEAEEYFKAAQSLYLASDEKVGRINCALSLSDVYRKTKRSSESLREALTAFTIAANIEITGLKTIVARLVILRQEIGKESFSALVGPVVESFPVEDREGLLELLKALEAAFEGQDAASEASETASPTPAPGTPRPA